METYEMQREIFVAENLIGGESYDLPDGKLLRLRVEDDTDFDIRDMSDCYGLVEWVMPGSRQSERPAMFDGSARKVWVGGDCYWWQPPLDIIGDPEAIRGARRALVDLLVNGTQTIIVEVCEGSDAYGKPIVRDVAALGGVEWYSDQDHRLDIVTGLLSELGAVI